MITSTITRPTTIAPTSVQHSKLHVQEVIDVAPIQRPKPVALSIESSQKKGKPKSGEKKTAMPSASGRTSKSSSHDSTNGVPTVRAISTQIEEEPPRSPVPSVISSTTATTSSTSSNGNYATEPKSYTASNSTEDLMTTSDPNTVSMKTELLQGGCLAGDALLIRISIKHNKPVKNMQGIIITLYRQGRIDTHPAIPVGPYRKGEKRRYEDYYPKSRTGLGGLSLSSSGSSRSFRQDLNQIFVPIIIDPTSLIAVINTSIQAPADLFPSITNVPGGMVSFRYFVETVVDLRGKLSGQDRIRPHLSMTSTPQHGYGDPKVSRCESADGVSYLSTPGFNYLITDQLRRTRGIISTRIEVTVGTRDSGRRRVKHHENTSRILEDRSLGDSVDLGREEEPETSRSEVERRHSALEVQEGEQLNPNGINHHHIASIPSPEPEEQLDEKAKMRRAEQRLLPSAPPQDEDAPSALTAPIPSAPPAIDEEDFIYRYGLRPPAPAYDGPSRTGEDMTRLNAQNNSAMGPPCMGQDSANPEDDKQELERQRLLAHASSPNYSGVEGADLEGNTPRAIAPTAPVLFEDDIFSIHDPRIPESSAADFADDSIASEEQMHFSKPSVMPVSEEISQADLGASDTEPPPPATSDEDRAWAANRPNSQIPSPCDYGMHGNVTDGTHEWSDIGVHDENLPVYRR